MSMYPGDLFAGRSERIKDEGHTSLPLHFLLSGIQWRKLKSETADTEKLTSKP